MQGAMVVVVANMKPSKMRSAMSYAMLIAASNADRSCVELVSPPPDSKIGERVTFEGYEGKPEFVLNPKKKIFEKLQPDLSTNSEGVATYKGVPFKTSAGVCKVKTLKNCKLS
eukprot:TRINITY_DN2858_c0_g1_i1.p1 TRINITY_DN2858_c0_g1~~TRINITY_DN2858_c0_g1_i1.p1  ORF type:complete len:113 (+),score=21.95 TRINITY_DN2858_c0_g1_i1:123-461(+)